jgi:hypothetical protein
MNSKDLGFLGDLSGLARKDLPLAEPRLYPHRGSGDPARSRSTKKRDISRPLADSLEAQSPQSSVEEPSLALRR